MTWLSRAGVRELRDHLSSLLGDKGAPEKFLPDAVWNAARTPSAIELASILRAEAQGTGITRPGMPLYRSEAHQVVAHALRGVADRLENLR